MAFQASDGELCVSGSQCSHSLIPRPHTKNRKGFSDFRMGPGNEASVLMCPDQ